MQHRSDLLWEEENTRYRCMKMKETNLHIRNKATSRAVTTYIDYLVTNIKKNLSTCVIDLLSIRQWWIHEYPITIPSFLPTDTKQIHHIWFYFFYYFCLFCYSFSCVKLYPKNLSTDYTQPARVPPPTNKYHTPHMHSLNLFHHLKNQNNNYKALKLSLSSTFFVFF
jgi:hypothetical protein